MAGRRQQLNMRMGSDDVARLDTLARARFGGNRTEAARWAYRVASEVLTDASTYPAAGPAEALTRYITARKAEA